MAALGAHRRQPFDLDGDHLEDPRGAPPQRSAFLQFDVARGRPAATTAWPPAAARRAQAWLLSKRNRGDQTDAVIAGDAPRAAPHRARQTRELLSEGDVR